MDILLKLGFILTATFSVDCLDCQECNAVHSSSDDPTTQALLLLLSPNQGEYQCFIGQDKYLSTCDRDKEYCYFYNQTTHMKIYAAWDVVLYEYDAFLVDRKCMSAAEARALNLTVGCERRDITHPVVRQVEEAVLEQYQEHLGESAYLDITEYTAFVCLCEETLCNGPAQDNAPDNVSPDNRNSDGEATKHSMETPINSLTTTLTYSSGPSTASISYTSTCLLIALCIVSVTLRTIPIIPSNLIAE